MSGDALPIRIRNIFVREPGDYRAQRPHVHQATQWYHCLSGGLTVAIDSHVRSMRPGDSVLVPPRARRELWRSGDAPGYLVAIFEDRRLDLTAVHDRLLTAPEDLRSDLEALTQELGSPARPDSTWLCQALLLRVLIGLRRTALGQLGRRGVRADHRERRRLVAQVEAHMQRHLQGAADRHAIAAALRISAPHLARRFKAATGKTLHERCTEIRMAQAAFLLRDSDLSIGQVARQVGVSSQSHFTKAFRVVYGVTPSVYRSG